MTDTYNKLENLIEAAAPGRLREHRRQVLRQVERDLAAHRFEAVRETLRSIENSGDQQLVKSIRNRVDRHIEEVEHKSSPAYREELRQQRIGRKREGIIARIMLAAGLAGFVMAFAWAQLMSPPMLLSAGVAVGCIVLAAGSELFASLYVDHMPEALQPRVITKTGKKEARAF